MSLVRHLEKHGHSCYFASDLEPQDEPVDIAGAMVSHKAITADALTLTTPLQGADVIITNTPWSRHILHPMIEHFRKHKRAWILLDAGWMFTKQSADYMGYCSKVVAVGRLRWIADTKMTGKDDCVWLCMEQTRCETIFIGR